MLSRSRGLMRPSFAINFPFRPESEGAGKAGCAPHPRSRVHKCTKKRTRAYRSSGGNPTFPARWFTAYFALSPVIWLSCHRHQRIDSANLTPTLRRQDHTTSPYAANSPVSRAATSIASRTDVRDVRETPLLLGRDGGSHSFDSPDGLSEIFLREGLDGKSGDATDLPVGRRDCRSKERCSATSAVRAQQSSPCKSAKREKTGR
jgi:hypothetical protein